MSLQLGIKAIDVLNVVGLQADLNTPAPSGSRGQNLECNPGGLFIHPSRSSATCGPSQAKRMSTREVATVSFPLVRQRLHSPRSPEPTPTGQRVARGCQGPAGRPP